MERGRDIEIDREEERETEWEKGGEGGTERERARQFSTPMLNYHFAHLSFITSAIEIGCFGELIRSFILIR